MSRSTNPVPPVSASIVKVEASPVNPDPSPSNEPLNDPEAVAPVNVSPAKVVAVVPKSTSVDPSVTLSLANIALVTPLAFTLNESELISIDESSTFTTNSPAEVPKPAPSIVLISKPTPFAVILTGFTFPPVVESASTVTVAPAEPLKVKSAIPFPSTIELTKVSAETPVNPDPSPSNEPLNEPDATSPVAPVVLTTVPDPLLPTVVNDAAPSPTKKLLVPVAVKPVPPLATVNAVSNVNPASSAEEPETMTFFHSAILFF